MPSLGHLFTDAVADVRRLPSRDTITVLGAGALAAMSARPFDVRVSASLSRRHQPGGPNTPGATIGALSMQLGGAFSTYAVGRMTGSPKVALLGADLFRAQLLAQGMTQAMKHVTTRTRPDGTALSLPSGHTASAFASASVLQRHFGWKIGAPAYAMATYVATSRIQDRRHYLSDVAFGAAVGLVAGRTVTFGRERARFAVQPVAVAGGGGVSLTWVGRR
jgi:membrane-associated phospholipid phosphatase